MQEFLSRLIKLHLPKLCVFNGHAYAGGLLLGLCHDYIIMSDNPKAKVCLNEINLGMVPLPGYLWIAFHTLKPSTRRIVFLGAVMTPQRAK